jgi:hypothetical protein
MHVHILAVEIVTPCTSIGYGNGYTLPVHTASCGNRYTMHVHIVGVGGGERDTTARQTAGREN